MNVAELDNRTLRLAVIEARRRVNARRRTPRHGWKAYPRWQAPTGLERHRLYSALYGWFRFRQGREDCVTSDRAIMDGELLERLRREEFSYTSDLIRFALHCYANVCCVGPADYPQSRAKYHGWTTMKQAWRHCVGRARWKRRQPWEQGGLDWLIFKAAEERGVA